MATETVLLEIGLFVSSTGNFNTSILDNMRKLKNNAFVGAVFGFSDPVDDAGPAHLQDRGHASVLQRQTQQE